jgi:hypothetical protein
MRCEAFVTRGSADEWARVCDLRAFGWCYGCGIAICNQHSVACRKCHRKFCAGCMTFHLEEHFKLAQPLRLHGERKSA